MEEVLSGASALSTYGLYAIVAALSYICWRLYQRTGVLEERFRTYIEQKSEAYSAALSASTTMLGEAKEALNRVAAVMEGMGR